MNIAELHPPSQYLLYHFFPHYQPLVSTRIATMSMNSNHFSLIVDKTEDGTARVASLRLHGVHQNEFALAAAGRSDKLPREIFPFEICPNSRSLSVIGQAGVAPNLKRLPRFPFKLGQLQVVLQVERPSKNQHCEVLGERSVRITGLTADSLKFGKVALLSFVHVGFSGLSVDGDEVGNGADSLFFKIVDGVSAGDDYSGSNGEGSRIAYELEFSI